LSGLRRAWIAAALATLAAAAAQGCGAAAPDLFAVHRTGEGAGARLDLVVSDGGSVRCDGHSHPLDAKRLLRARQVARDLAKQAELGLELPPGPRTVLSYRVRLQAGTVAFSDSSPSLPRSFAEVQAFTRDVSQDVCGLPR
jgi:hypothetical protein